MSAIAMYLLLVVAALEQHGHTGLSVDDNMNKRAQMGEAMGEATAFVQPNTTAVVAGECIIGALCQLQPTPANFDALWNTCQSSTTAAGCAGASSPTGSCCWSPTTGPSSTRGCQSGCGPVTPVPTPAPAAAHAHIVRITSYTDLKCIDLPRPHFYEYACSGCNVNATGTTANCTSTQADTCPWMPPEGSISSAVTPFVYNTGELARVSEACASWCHNRLGNFVGAIYTPGPSVDINNYGATNLCYCLTATNYFLGRAVPTENLDLILTHDGAANCPR